ncbi:MAG: MiaB/RimO family radical SAM methylthiotransferase [Patescibacteria group bacterium]|nr:MiaB/RimO family radical SAM methylthiotransferase [Patescibacteria group bacterium]
MTVCFYTFGCKLNQAETEELKEKFLKQGWEIKQGNIKADLYVINACAVTQKAEKEVRQLIHRVKKNYPRSLLAVIGCFTSEIKKTEKKVDFWINNFEKYNILKIISLKTRRPQKAFNKIERRNRFLIRIQTGCQHYCSYCIVPFFRPKIFNRPLKEIIKEINEKEKQGCQEAVLVGTNIGLYREKEFNFVDSLREILKKTAISRIRLSSLWPTNIDQDLLSLFKNKRLCPHFHLSIQSASDRILKLMNREYTRADLEKIIKGIKKIPAVGLTADFIVGFPGEKDIDFQKTKNFIKSAGFLKIHVFRFSPRPQTAAVNFKNQITERIKQERSQELIELGKKIGENGKNKLLKTRNEVLIESKINSYWQGWTGNYLKVFVQNSRCLINKIVKVKLIKRFREGFIGQIIE